LVKTAFFSAFEFSVHLKCKYILTSKSKNTNQAFALFHFVKSGRLRISTKQSEHFSTADDLSCTFFCRITFSAFGNPKIPNAVLFLLPNFSDTAAFFVRFSGTLSIFWDFEGVFCKKVLFICTICAVIHPICIDKYRIYWYNVGDNYNLLTSGVLCQ